MGLNIVPVIVGTCAWQVVPWLSQLQLFARDGNPLVSLLLDDVGRKLMDLVVKIDAMV